MSKISNIIKSVCLFGLLLTASGSFAQNNLSNQKYFKQFFKSGSAKDLLIIGENHGSAASAGFYPGLVKFLYKKAGVRTLLIEFGPAEAFFYNRYLETGDEKHLNYTIYAGPVQEWRDAWRTLYQYNRKLKKPLEVVGIDFDRTRTMAYALYSILMKYENRPEYLKPILSEIRTDSFYKTYSVGYPSKKDIEWSQKTKMVLKENSPHLKEFVSAGDWAVIERILLNEAVAYNDEREKALAKNVQREVENSPEDHFLLLIGRNHAYMEPLFGNKDMLAKRIADSTDIRFATGVLLYENSNFMPSRTKKDSITLFEVTKKSPWKRHADIINKKSKSPLHIVPLGGELCDLKRHVDFIIVARNQEPYTLINSSAANK